MADTMKGLKRTHYCGTVTPEMIGREVVVCGWAQKTRDMGTLVFIDLRDRTGIVQLAFDDKTDPALLAKAQKVRAEYVLMARGVLRQRESVNHEIPTGEVEVYVTELRVLAESNTPPFAISDDSRGVKEDLRLKYRYLDLRRPEMQNAIAMRHRIVKIARDYYDTNGFYEIETPILIKSTPEGARDYLVPSRVQQGRFYALPQSPQLYKQILMCSGFDRYMQIARCFRDEDLRADRQPEFTQIDVEMSFIDEEDIMAMNEGFMKRIFKEVLGKDLETPFRRIKYQDAMDNYGIDKPDTRFDLRLHDLSEILKNTEFSVFSGAIAGGGSVRGINAKGAAEKLSRKEIDKLADFVKTYRAKGLAYTRWTHEGRTSSFEKFLTEEEIAGIHKALEAEEGDLLLSLKEPPKLSATPGKPLEGITVMVDPGHGNKDCGAYGAAGLYGPAEAELNLAVSLAVRDRLEQMGATVIMTRETDDRETPKIVLDERVRMAVDAKPDFFLSIHHNSTGLTKYVSADWTVSYYCEDDSETYAANLAAAVTGATDRDTKGEEWGYYYVTRLGFCPAVLFEVGFIPNPEQYEACADWETICETASGLAEGLLRSVPR